MCQDGGVAEERRGAVLSPNEYRRPGNLEGLLEMNLSLLLVGCVNLSFPNYKWE